MSVFMFIPSIGPNHFEHNFKIFSSKPKLWHL